MSTKFDLTVAGYVFFEEKVLLIFHKKYKMWLPVGGHIDINESPDQALRREMKEEVNLSISFLQKNQLTIAGNIKENTAIPFSTNIHIAGDHDHYALYYVCYAEDASDLKCNEEVKEIRWFTKEELQDEAIGLDIREQAEAAFDIWERFDEVK